MKFNATAFAAKKFLSAADIKISLGNIHQIFAAGLGYKSLASLQASSEEKPGLEEAAYVIFDEQAMRRRCEEVGQAENVTDVINALQAGLEACSNAPSIYYCEKTFIEDEAYRFAQENALEHEEVNAASAETNAYFSDVCVECGDDPVPLNDAIDIWEIPVTGNVSMDQDEDRMYCGDNILIDGTVLIKKVGRRCLSNNMELDIAASVDQSPFEDDGP